MSAVWHGERAGSPWSLQGLGERARWRGAWRCMTRTQMFAGLPGGSASEIPRFLSGWPHGRSETFLPNAF